jgi:N-acetylglutamate synthase-like GNAT family acetyltransferase
MSVTMRRPKKSTPQSFTIRRARADDVESLVELLGASVPHCLPQTVWELPWAWHHYRVACSDDGEIIGAASLQPQSSGRAEVRGLTVASAWRGHGIAAALLTELIGEADRSSLDVVCVTRFPDFFSRFGFRETPPDWIDHHHRRSAHPARPKGPRIAMTRAAEA